VIPTIISNMTELGLAECEIMSAHVEPFPGISTGWWVPSRRAAGFNQLRENARRWRLTVPLEYYGTIRRQFEDAGLRMHLYNINFNETFTDAERERTFEAAKALGVEGFSALCLPKSRNEKRALYFRSVQRRVSPRRTGDRCS
jgi:hypothetical protein